MRDVTKKPRDRGEGTGQILRPPRSFAVISASSACFFLGGAAITYKVKGLDWTTWALISASVIGLAGVIETLVTKVELGKDALIVTTLRGIRRLSRPEIKSVFWSRGSPVSLELASGRWFKLPAVGRTDPGLANILRAWLKRTG